MIISVALPQPETIAETAARFSAALAAGRARVEQERAKSPQDSAEERQLDHEKKRQEVVRATLANLNERALIGLRKVYGWNMVVFLWVYFIATITLLVLHSLKLLTLPDGVAVALVGGTAVAVLGVVGTVVAGLFRVKSDT